MTPIDPPALQFSVTHIAQSMLHLLAAAELSLPELSRMEINFPAPSFAEFWASRSRSDLMEQKRTFIEWDSVFYQQPFFLTHIHFCLTHNPSFLTHNPSFLTHNPSFLTPNPSFLTHNPSFLTPNPSFLTHNPSFLTHNPSLLTHNPSFLTPLFCDPQPFSFLSDPEPRSAHFLFDP